MSSNLTTCSKIIKMVHPSVNCYYQHRYGGVYIVKDVATSTVDGTKWVVYSHVYPFEYATYIRPYNEWTDGRFSKLDNDSFYEIQKKDRAEFRLEIENNKHKYKV